TYSRPELEFVSELVTTEIADAGSRPFPERILAVAKFLDLFSKSSFAEVKDEKRREFVATLSRGVREQVKKGILRAKDAAPSFAERLLFRQILGMSVRREPVDLIRAGSVVRASRTISAFLMGLAFSAGGGVFTPSGRERKVRAGEVRRFAPDADPSSPEADGALTRYFVAHLASRRVLDPAFKPREALASLGLLLRQYPAILFFARAASFARDGETVDRSDYASALRTADWTFGHVDWMRGLAGRAWRTLLADMDAPFQHLAWAARRPG
ncbi:hypothetical protein HY251_04875, partial [bacterium]|nr:hypothetical protein [bacterium]